MSLICNKCYAAFEDGGLVKAVATSCGHIFCSQCSESVFPTVLRKDMSCVVQCPTCEDDLRRSNLSVVTVLANPSDVKMTLYGQAPDTIMSAAAAAIEFYANQLKVKSELRESHLVGRISQMKAQCNKKLEDLYSAYTTSKKRHQAALQEKAGLEQETRELQEKYRQKAKQNQELQRMFKELQAQNDSLRQNRGGPGLGSPSHAISNHSGGHVVTTVHQRQAAVFMGGGGGTPDILKGKNYLMSDEPGHGGDMLMGGGPPRQSRQSGQYGLNLPARSPIMNSLMGNRGGITMQQGSEGMRMSAQQQQLLAGLPGVGSGDRGQHSNRLLQGGGGLRSL